MDRATLIRESASTKEALIIMSADETIVRAQMIDSI
jgi:hypothetical protein